MLNSFLYSFLNTHPLKQKNQLDDVDGNARWAVFCSAITFATTAVVVALHMSPVFSHFIVNTKVEGALCVILCAFWATTVSIVSNANTGLAVDNDAENNVVNGNLYYFSWAGFVTSVILLVAYLRGVFGVDVAGEIRSRAARLTLWSGLLACSLVVMGSSANIFDKDCSTQVETAAYCARTKYAISLGAISTIFSLGIVGLKMATSMAPFLVEAGFSLLLAIFNGFGVAFITSAAGPGSPIGNLYYFTWLSFLCSLMLCASCYEDYNNAGNEATQSSSGDVEAGKANQDIPVENLEGDGNF